MPKYIVNEMPDMEGKGKHRVYPKLDAYRLLKNDELVKEVNSYHRAVSKSVIEDVNFKADQKLIKKLRTETELERQSSGVVKVSQTPFSLEERIKRCNYG